MEQQQIKVSFSLGTKLLLSVVVLLFTAIIFLSVSSIYLFREDKRAYTYQTQSTESLLAGREFVTSTKRSLEVLKTLLALMDPSKALTPLQKGTLQSLMDNQSEIVSSDLYLLNVKTAENKLIHRVSKEKELKAFKLDAKDYEVPQEWLKSLIPDLLRNSYAFLNLAKMGSTPTFCVVLADVGLKDNPNGMPIALGVLALKDFADRVSSLKLSIATKAGWVLYDTDPTIYFAKGTMLENPLFKAAIASQTPSGALEYDFNKSHFLGSYLKPGFDLVVLSNMNWEVAMRATYTMIEKFLLLGLMVVSAAIVFAILFSKTLTAPILKLYNATKAVAGGDFQLRLDERGRDEIGALSASFNIMSKKIGELIDESVRKVQLENEMAIASTVQQTLIPPEDFKIDWLHIHSHYEAADHCGGDWWGFFGVGSRVAIMIADATGHGLPSALMTAAARSCFSVMHKLAQEDPEFSFSPSAMLSFANRVIFDASMGNIMMTFFVGVIDIETQTLTYSSAGHNPPWLFKKRGSGFESVSLMVPGERLGEKREATPFEEKSVSVGPGDILFLYTDGLTEDKNEAGEFYGKKQVRKIVEASLYGGPETIVSTLMADFQRHNGGKPLDDDVTVAVARILEVTKANA